MTLGDTTARTDGETLLALRKLDKRFGATHALKAVDLTFEQGEIHAIVGENGAGKSTLIKLLTGVHPRTSGEVLWRGAPVALATPHEAINLGINAVHQEVVLCPHLTVAANIFLGDEEMRGGLLDHKRMVRDGQKLLDDLGFALPATAILSSLTIGQQQLVATARAERRGAKFLIFDEPTAYLTRQETAALFKLIRRLKANGVTIVYISHRLEEVFELCDRVSVLRDGALVGTRRIDETNEAALIALMINRTIEQIYHKDASRSARQSSRPKGSRGKAFTMSRSRCAKARSSDSMGSSALAAASSSKASSAAIRRASGRISWLGRDVSIRSERQAMDLGIALAPESRRDQGLCLGLGVGFNINLPIFQRLSVGPLINLGREVGRGGQADPRCADQDRLARRRGVEPFRRQPAKGRDRQMAQSRRQALHFRRTYRRRRRRDQGGNLSPARLSAQARAPASS